jgi:hypothetical protein
MDRLHGVHSYQNVRRVAACRAIFIGTENDRFGDVDLCPPKTGSGRVEPPAAVAAVLWEEPLADGTASTISSRPLADVRNPRKILGESSSKAPQHVEVSAERMASDRVKR